MSEGKQNGFKRNPIQSEYPKPPCYECRIRSVGCHSTCRRYLEWDRERERQQKRIRRAKERESNFHY